MFGVIACVAVHTIFRIGRRIVFFVWEIVCMENAK